MGGSGQSPVTTQTATKDPWSGAVPFLNQAMSTAAGLQDAGMSASYNPYQGPVNADVYPWLQQGQQTAMNIASDPSTAAGVNAANQLGTSQMTDEGITPTLGGAVLTPLLGNVTGQYGDIAQNGLGQTQGMGSKDYLNAVYNNIIQNTPEQVNNYRDVINRANAPTNPILQSIMDTQNRRITDQIGSSMSGAGRYGSGMYADTAARALGETEAPEMYQDYQQRQTNAMNANAGLGQVFGQQGQAAQGMLGADQADVNARLAGTQGLGQTYSTAADIYGQGLNRAGQWAQLSPTLQAAQYGPANEMQQLGGFYQGRSQNDLNQQIQLYNAEQAYPWESLSRFNAIIGGAGGLGGSTVGTSQTQVPLMQRLLGGALAGGGLGSAFGPIGTGVGALGGGLAGGFI